MTNTCLRTSVRAATLALVAALAASGCNSVEKAPPRPLRADLDPSFRIEVSQIMRGTVAQEAILLGYQPTLVRGYGLVVGLDGTGSNDMPQDLRAHMLAIAAQRGIGMHASGWADLSPEQLLDSPDTAVVVVEALIPPGAKEGTRFDVRVMAHPMTSTSSLEGGRLYTSELAPADVPGMGPWRLPPTGSRQAASLAQAGGPIFLNPFAEPRAVERDTVTRTVGRILNGGVVLKDMPIKLRLATPSHERARSLQGVINARFPQEPGQRDPTARGESEEAIVITVPPSFRERTADFVELLHHTTLAAQNPERIALSIRRLVEQTPAFATAASWRWQALGPRVVPVIRELYDHPEELPRLAALRAGAGLNDAVVVPHLIDLARTGSAAVRRDTIDLLARMGQDLRINHALRDMLSDDDASIRIAAYEALVDRGDLLLAREVVDRKFVLDIIESDEPMIYITQIGQPRIVLFGADLAIERPITLAAWSNRLMLKGDWDEPHVEIFYRDPDASEPVITRVDADLKSFIRFLGHETSVEQPEPGLGLSYAETVGALHQIWSQKYVKADFKAQQDLLLAAILEQERGTRVPTRPEFEEEEGASDEDAGMGRDAPATDSGSELSRLAPPEAEPRSESGRPDSRTNEPSTVAGAP